MPSFFSNEMIDKILACLSETSIADADDVDIAVEFKESFNKAGIPEYGRTMAGFANARGGYLVFGVRDKPREVVGLQNDQFMTVDPAITTNTLNEFFEPALRWSHHTCEVAGKRLGLIHVAQADLKPVICRRHKDKDLREGAVYYRYLGRTQEIRPAELNGIINDERKKIHQQWHQLLSKIGTVGVSEVGILDLKTGEVSGSVGSFFIDEDLLPKLQFIQHGTFVETGGGPTLRLIGDLQPVGLAATQSTRYVKVPTVITGFDLIRAFLHQNEVQEPMQWVRAICNDQSANFPVHYFLAQAGKALDEGIAEIDSVVSRNVSKGRLLQALRHGRQFQRGTLEGETDKIRLRRNLLDGLKSRTVTADDLLKDFDRGMEAILHLKSGDTDLNYVLTLISDSGLQRYGQMKGTQATRFRSAVCHIDEEWFRQPTVLAGGTATAH